MRVYLVDFKNLPECTSSSFRMRKVSEKLEKRRIALEKDIDDVEKLIAATLTEMKDPKTRSKARQRGVKLLKKKKALSANLDKVENQQFNVEMMRIYEEQIETDREVAACLKAAKKKRSDDMVMDEFYDLVHENNEISEILAGGVHLHLDDDDLKEELDIICSDIVDEDSVSEEVISVDLSEPDYDSDIDLDELFSWM